MKYAFVIFLVYSVNCQFAAAGNSSASDKVAGFLYSEIKYVESEIMRVWVTIEALEEEIHQNPDTVSDEINKRLGELYLYDCELNYYLGELEIELSGRDNPSDTIFKKGQLKPIHVSTMMYRVPPDAIPVPDGSRITIRKRGQ